MTFPVPQVLQANEWLGNDGNWSTWEIAAGTPPQRFNVLPSTSHGEIWLPVPEGCTWLTDNGGCGPSRGVHGFEGVESLGFQTNASSTWSQIGIYELSAGGDLFNTVESGLYGLDTVSVASDARNITDQAIAGIATKDFWLGSMGLSQQASDFAVADEVAESLLNNMKRLNMTPSVSFGLAVGTSYDALQGSLVIGGFDKSLSQDPGISIPTSDNQTRALMVSVQSIVATNTLQGTSSLTDDLPSLTMAIDSGVSQLWLPPAVCDELSELFGLSYDNQTGLYLANDTAREQLLGLSPEVTFTLSANATSNETVSIVLPYRAFDLMAGVAIFNETTRYFPIRRATNDTLYVLGRTFLQEAYLVVDWERANFTVSQLSHQRPANAEIVPILPVSHEPPKPSGLSAGAIAGIVVGIVVVLAAVLAAAYFFWWRKRRSKRAESVDEGDEKSRPISPYPQDKKTEGPAELGADTTLLTEADSGQVHELHQEQMPHQLMSTQVYELPAEMVERELDAGPKPRKD